MKNKNGCVFCYKNESEYEYKNFILRHFKYWTVELSKENSHLKGKCIVRLNRHLENFNETNVNERKELSKIIDKLTKTLKDLFNPDMFNYEILGNSERHVHLYLTPRYNKKIDFSDVGLNVNFLDKFGERYCEIKDPKVSPKVLQNIRDKIKNKLN